MSLAWLFLPGVVVAGCVEYHPRGDPRPEDPPATTGPVEACNGADDDADGQVDEGFPDVDLDGTRDCVDRECTMTLRPAGVAESSGTCTPEWSPSSDPWDVEVMWEVSAGGNPASAVAGDLDGDRLPEVAWLDAYGGVHVLDGRSGEERWASSAISAGWDLGLVDTDEDGDLEILGLGSLGEVVALDGRGDVVWQSADAPQLASSLAVFGVVPTDLDADALAELVTQAGVLRAGDGSWVTRFEDPSVEVRLPVRDVAAGDVDLDGVPEIFDLFRCLNPDGSVDWDVSPGGDLWASVPVLIQADEDAEGEIVWLSDARLMVLDPSGRAFWQTDTSFPGGGTVSQGCAGELDGEGFMDFVFDDGVAVRALRADGTELWSRPYDDFTEAWVRCTTFDFDVDGVDEVIYSDDSAMRILRGTDGSVLWEDSTWESGTGSDAKLVVDLDGDGSVEIVGTAWPVGERSVDIRAYRHARGEWPPGMALWPTTNWSGTELNADGSVPRTARAPWLEHRGWRSQPEFAASGADLRPEVGDTCVASCEAGPVRVAVHLVNDGPEEADAGAPLAVYATQADGTRVLLEVVRLAEWLDDGHRSPDLELELTLEQAMGGLELVAGDDGDGAVAPGDCDPTDDTLRWRLDACDAEAR